MPDSRPQVDRPRGSRTSPRSPRLGLSEIRFWVEVSRVTPTQNSRPNQAQLPREFFPGPGSADWCRGQSLCTDRGYETRTVSFPYCVSMNRPCLVFLRSPRGSGRAVGSMSPRSYRPYGEQLATATAEMTGFEPAPSIPLQSQGIVLGISVSEWTLLPCELHLLASC